MCFPTVGVYMINELLNKADIISGVIMVLISVTGIIFTKGTGFVQIFHLPKAFKYMFSGDSSGAGEVSSFASLCTALAASIGTGNIVGVATAVCTGGPGALFWMVVSAFFGMATIYAEGLLAVKYRRKSPDGSFMGGPFYYIEGGMGKRWKWLSVLFAIFGMLAGLSGIGTVTQINGVTAAANDFFDPYNLTAVSIFGKNYSISVIISGAAVTLSAALVLMGGFRRIARVSDIAVPFMALIFTSAMVLIILRNIGRVPGAVCVIIEGAFNPDAVTGGVVGSIVTAVHKGVSRGIFSNEAGLGSAGIAAAAAKTDSPVRQGLVCMLGTFVDTIVLCTMTGIVLVLTDAWQAPGAEGAAVTAYAFRAGLPFEEKFSSFILLLCLTFFAFTSMLGWNYYSEICLNYLSGGRKIPLVIFRVLYIAAIFMGPYLTVEAVWSAADIFNCLMAVPNLIALIYLRKTVFGETKKFIDKC